MKNTMGCMVELTIDKRFCGKIVQKIGFRNFSGLKNFAPIPLSLPNKNSTKLNFPKFKSPQILFRNFQVRQQF